MSENNRKEDFKSGIGDGDYRTANRAKDQQISLRKKRQEKIMRKRRAKVDVVMDNREAVMTKLELTYTESQSFENLMNILNTDFDSKYYDSINRDFVNYLMSAMSKDSRAISCVLNITGVTPAFGHIQLMIKHGLFNIISDIITNQSGLPEYLLSMLVGIIGNVCDESAFLRDQAIHTGAVRAIVAARIRGRVSQLDFSRFGSCFFDRAPTPDENSFKMVWMEITNIMSSVKPESDIELVENICSIVESIARDKELRRKVLVENKLILKIITTLARHDEFDETILFLSAKTLKMLFSDKENRQTLISDFKVDTIFYSMLVRGKETDTHVVGLRGIKIASTNKVYTQYMMTNDKIMPELAKFYFNHATRRTRCELAEIATNIAAVMNPAGIKKCFENYKKLLYIICGEVKSSPDPDVRYSSLNALLYLIQMHKTMEDEYKKTVEKAIEDYGAYDMINEMTYSLNLGEVARISGKILDYLDDE